MQRLNRSDNVRHGMAVAHHTRPGLLVSVRDMSEAQQAALAGVQIIDLKDPSKGTLGWADPELWQAVAREFPQATLSAAMGELNEAIPLAQHVPAAFRFAKSGPIGAQTEEELVWNWRILRERLPATVQLVAVAYADHEQARTLTAESIFRAAVTAGLTTWLLDTFLKDGRSSVQHLGIDRLSSLFQSAEPAGAKIALAGSITLDAAQQCLENNLYPAWFAVRGDVCEHGRDGRLSDAQLRRWIDWLRSSDFNGLRSTEMKLAADRST